MEVLDKSVTPRKHITVLQCNTEYPTPIEYVNLTEEVEVDVEVEVEVIVNETCINNFTCSGWEPINCSFGERQERSCFDANGCVDLVYLENQTCLVEDIVNETEVILDVEEKGFILFSFLENIVGYAGDMTRRGEKPALFTLFGLVLIGLLTPIVLWRVNHKEKYYEISDLHAFIDGHEIHIRSSVGANKGGTKGEIIEQWESDVDDYMFESVVGKV